MNRILVTGGSGFVGRAMVRVLGEKQYPIRATFRDSVPASEGWDGSGPEWVRYELANGNCDYPGLLDGVETVIHLAGLAHITGQGRGSTSDIKSVNAGGTARLAEESAARGIKRFIFISTAKVHGGITQQSSEGNTRRFTERDLPAPADPYAAAKHEAEEAVRETCRKSSMGYTIFRPPLVYGPGVKANFLRFLGAVYRGIPLPLTSVENLRSLLFVGNLCHAIVTSIEHRGAANQVFLIKDVDISVPDLVRTTARLFGKKAMLFPFPVAVLRFAGKCLGKSDVIDRLTGSLVIDDSKLRRELRWTPPVSFEDGLRKTVEWYRNAVNGEW